MKKLILMLPIAAMLYFASCDNDGNDNNADNNDKDTVTVHDRDTVVIRERETYRTQLQADIDRMQTRLDSMDNSAAAKADKNYQKRRTTLKMRLDRAKADLQEFGNKADNEWDDFRTRVNANMDTMGMEWDTLVGKRKK